MYKTEISWLSWAEGFYLIVKMQEIELANEQVTKSLADARRERKDFEKIKNQIELVLQNPKVGSSFLTFILSEGLKNS